MSCCGGNCGCGPSCGCGSGCRGCKMFPDLSFGDKAVESPFVSDTASDAGCAEEGRSVGGEGGCKCGSNCSCDPCNCNN